MKRRTEAERWLRFAADDLRMGRLAFREGIHTQACFHAQQCAEKAVKGLLVYVGQSPPRTHRMLHLMRLLPTDSLASVRADVGLLDLFYIPTRYPDALPGSLPDGYPTEDVALRALELAERGYQEVLIELKRES